MLPKSLHTVRILVAVARDVLGAHANRAMTELEAVTVAADIIGYPDASANDPLIVKAAALLAKSVQS